MKIALNCDCSEVHHWLTISDHDVKQLAESIRRGAEDGAECGREARD